MYKVLKKKNGRLVSCIISKGIFSGHSWWTVRYIPQRWVKARKGKLFVFRLLEDAKHFRVNEHGDEIWRCQTKNTKKFPCLSKLSQGMFKEFWKNNDYGFAKLFPYVSTYGADKVKLTKRVWPVREKR